MKIMDSQEFKHQIQLIYNVVCVAALSKLQFDKVLNDDRLFQFMYGGSLQATGFSLELDGEGEVFKIMSSELLNKNNDALFTGWQVILSITGMSATFEYYLKSTADKITGKSSSASSIFHRFKDKTGIDISEFGDYKKILRYYNVRHITLHNFGQIDQKFIDAVQSTEKVGTPFVYKPIHSKEYKDSLERLADFIENKIK